MSDNRKEMARTMRQAGESISVIARKIGASRSSVSVWVRDIVLSDEQTMLLKARWHSPAMIAARRDSRLRNESTKRQLIIDEAAQDILSMSAYELLLVGTALYWAEGGKTQRLVRFSNGDPKMMILMMRFFREICSAPEEKLRGHIHIHSSLNVDEAENYWSEVTKIPRAQFFKTYNKPNISSKNTGKTSLPHGVCDVYVLDARLFLKIQGWISAMSKLNGEANY